MQPYITLHLGALPQIATLQAVPMCNTPATARLVQAAADAEESHAHVVSCALPPSCHDGGLWEASEERKVWHLRVRGRAGVWPSGVPQC